jgi:hypothetical protein
VLPPLGGGIQDRERLLIVLARLSTAAGVPEFEPLLGRDLRLPGGNAWRGAGARLPRRSLTACSDGNWQAGCGRWFRCWASGCAAPVEITHDIIDGAGFAGG